MFWFWFFFFSFSKKPLNPRKLIGWICHKNLKLVSLECWAKMFQLKGGGNNQAQPYNLAWESNGWGFGFFFSFKKNNYNPSPLVTVSVSLIIWKTWPHPVEEKIREISDCILKSALNKYFSILAVEMWSRREKRMERKDYRKKEIRWKIRHKVTTAGVPVDDISFIYFSYSIVFPSRSSVMLEWFWGEGWDVSSEYWY